MIDETKDFKITVRLPIMQYHEMKSLCRSLDIDEISLISKMIQFSFECLSKTWGFKMRVKKYTEKYGYPVISLEEIIKEERETRG